MAQGLEDGPGAGPLTFGAVHVRHPCHHEGYGDEDHDGQVYAKVAWCGSCSRGEEDEAHCSDEAKEADEGTSDAHFVCDEVDCENDEETKEIRWSR